MIYKHSLPYNFMKLSSNMTVIVAPKVCLDLGQSRAQCLWRTWP